MKLFYATAFCLASTFAVSASASVSDPSFVPTYQSRSYPIKHATGYIPTEKGREFKAKAPHKTFVGSSTPVPGSYSLRGHAGPVDDQGTCGSCWDFSLTGVLRGTWIMAGKDPGRLSYNYLLNCATTQQGCNGGDFPAAAYFVSPQGAPAYGSDGTYTGVDGSCVQATPVASTVSYVMLGNDEGNFPNSPTPSFQDIAYAVGVLHQPVSIDVAVDNNWENYASGVYNKCTDEKVADINHMVAIEGYSCETSVDSSGNCVFDANGNLPAGVGTWIIRNSWGTDWGDAGYITTKATDKNGKACNAVASDALYFTLTGN
jgi:KDEL-tailed cysteine endopeptidase